MRKFTWFAVLAMGLLAFAGTASAFPVIDGAITGTEWDSYFLQGFDPNEAGITDNYDILEVRVYQENSGVAGDGLYFLMTTYAPPTFTGQGASPTGQAFFVFGVDVNGDGDTNDNGDLLVQYNDQFGAQVVAIRDGGFVLLGSGTGALGSVVEVFAPESVTGVTNFSTSQAFASLDNQGTDADDRIPNQGFFTPVPEPGSMMLLGFGAAVAGLRRIRRKTVRS